MAELYNPKMYPVDLRRKLRLMPRLTVAIVNRWALGWPKAVKALIDSGEYLAALKAQDAQERKVLAEPGNNHLADHEKIELAGLSMAPPTATTASTVQSR